MGRKNWSKCYDCGRKLNVKRMEKSGHNHGCEYCWRRIRLMGIDTPESRTRNLEEKERGLLSKAYIENRCPVGSTIMIESLDRGKFGRILGNIWEAGQDANPDTSINKRMIADGFAVEYYGGSKDDLEAAHMKNKEILIEKGLLSADE